MTEDAAIASILKRARRYGYKSPCAILRSGLCRFCGEVFFTVHAHSSYCNISCRAGNCVGPKNGKWRGGVKKNSSGYVLVRTSTHSRLNNGRYVLEHVLAMERHLGRPLMRHENIHHKNGFRDDNRIENLELWCHPQMHGQRVEDLVDFVAEHYKQQVLMKIDLKNAVSSVLRRLSENGTLAKA